MKVAILKDSTRTCINVGKYAELPEDIEEFRYQEVTTGFNISPGQEYGWTDSTKTVRVVPSDIESIGENGIVYLDADKQAAKEAAQETARKDALLTGAYAQQNAILDPNMTALYWEAKGADLIGPKMSVYDDFMVNLLWPEYHLRKANGSTDYDFSNINPTATYSFLELQEELQSLKQ
jgi:hypothetical protein